MFQKKYIIFDLDGCIADDRRRLPLINMKAEDPWAAYHADCANDPLINHYYISLARGYKVIILTARPEKFRLQTLDWLKRVANINVTWLLMRNDGCFLSSPKIKKMQLEFLLHDVGIDAGEISMALDDRLDVLQVYKQYKIRTIKTEYPSAKMQGANQS